MKLATLKEGGRDGTLVVVSEDLSRAIRVPQIAFTLQQALDGWAKAQHALRKVYGTLNDGQLAGAFDLDPHALAAPLPRAYQWVDGSAYVNHVELVRKARGAEMPPSFWTDPLMYQGCSDAMLGPRDPIRLADESWGIDFEAEVAVITGDVPMGVSAQDALSHIRLVTLVNDVSLRNLIPTELAKGFGFFHSKPASAFAPVVVTPDLLGDAWQSGKLHRPLCSWRGEALFGEPNAGIDMTFDFGTLIAHAAHTRFLTAGTIVGSGTVSNTDRSTGSSCIAERRMIETIEQGEATTPFLRFGERVRFEMFDKQERSIFGAIEQTVERYQPPKDPGHA